MWQTEEALFWTIVAYTLPLFILKENKKFVKVNVNSEPVQYLLIAEGVTSAIGYLLDFAEILS